MFNLLLASSSFAVPVATPVASGEGAGATHALECLDPNIQVVVQGQTPKEKPKGHFLGVQSYLLSINT